MKALQLKVQELMSISRKEANGWDELEAKIKAQDALIEELKAMARERKTYIGRILKFPMADSYALYMVTAVTASKVHVQWLDYCDAWKDGRLGDSGNVDIKYARACAEFDDYLYKLKQDKLKEPVAVELPKDLSKSMF